MPYDEDILLSLVDWTNEAETLLLSRYAIDFTDAGLSAGDIERYWQRGESPSDWVDWYGDKYNLINVE